MSLTPGLHALARALETIDRTDPLLRVVLPLVTVSEANRRDKWAAVERAKSQRRWALTGVVATCQTTIGLRCNPSWLLAPANPSDRPLDRPLDHLRHRSLVVLLTRQAPRELDSDNLARALKAVRDGVAQALGVDDRDPRVVWVCDQRKGKSAVEIAVHAMEAR